MTTMLDFIVQRYFVGMNKDNLNDAVFMKDPPLYHKFENMLIFRLENLCSNK